MRGKAQRIARLHGIAVSPLASNSETQACCLLVNVDELTRVLIDAILCTVKLHYLQKCWIETHQIYMRYRGTVAASNAPIDISIVQHVWKYQCNEWRSSHDFCPINTRRYTNKKRYLRAYSTEVHQIFKWCSCLIGCFNAFMQMAMLHSIGTLEIEKTEGGQFWCLQNMPQFNWLP